MPAYKAKHERSLWLNTILYMPKFMHCVFVPKKRPLTFGLEIDGF